MRPAAHRVMVWAWCFWPIILMGQPDLTRQTQSPNELNRPVFTTLILFDMLSLLIL